MFINPLKPKASFELRKSKPTTLNGAMELAGKYYAALGNTEKVMMLQTASHSRHNWKDMKYKNKRDSNSHLKNQAKIGET